MPGQLPPQLSGLLIKLSETGRLLVEEYEGKKTRMQAIADELVWISNNFKVVQDTTKTTILHGAALGGLGVVTVGVGLALPFLPVPGKLALCLAGSIVTGCGGWFVGTANATKAMTEKSSRDTVKDLGKEFMQIIEVQKGLLVDIKTVSEELEEKSSSLRTTTGNQAKIGLKKTEDLQQLLRQTATLSEKSRITLTAEEDAKLRDFITEAALLCKNTVLEFAEMRNTLRDYEEMQA
ncbi:uncharacterized protein LOC117483978 isoform X3 [Trematomus bernacchii]|uniref:uncharacterized protein LOC117483978 isoform X2 n=1 Tax=Trematomus bernacchii TaxID=40690 RepID=UPI00146C5E2B|nr:uncharacterized protein LOC117483978 isoform X2 [Trematomus bernacchii]XP_033988274.1 uncharacterized protein LOC117483978 isoform X3 [Trematomus bernacchii]